MDWEDLLKSYVVYKLLLEDENKNKRKEQTTEEHDFCKEYEEYDWDYTDYYTPDEIEEIMDEYWVDEDEAEEILDSM